MKHVNVEENKGVIRHKAGKHNNSRGSSYALLFTEGADENYYRRNERNGAAYESVRGERKSEGTLAYRAQTTYKK